MRPQTKQTPGNLFVEQELRPAARWPGEPGLGLLAAWFCKADKRRADQQHCQDQERPFARGPLGWCERHGESFEGLDVSFCLQSSNCSLQVGNCQGALAH